jgi:hypothetical protein
MYVESPQRLTFEEGGYNGICVPMQVPADDLGTVMAGLTASRNVDGILVTMPHKFHCLHPVRHQFRTSQAAPSRERRPPQSRRYVARRHARWTRLREGAE